MNWLVRPISIKFLMIFVRFSFFYFLSFFSGMYLTISIKIAKYYVLHWVRKRKKFFLISQVFQTWLLLINSGCACTLNLVIRFSRSFSLNIFKICSTQLLLILDYRGVVHWWASSSSEICWPNLVQHHRCSWRSLASQYLASCCLAGNRIFSLALFFLKILNNRGFC